MFEMFSVLVRVHANVGSSGVQHPIKLCCIYSEHWICASCPGRCSCIQFAVYVYIINYAVCCLLVTAWPCVCVTCSCLIFYTHCAHPHFEAVTETWCGKEVVYGTFYDNVIVREWHLESLLFDLWLHKLNHLSCAVISGCSPDCALAHYNHSCG